MGSAGEAAMETHSIKKMDLEGLKRFPRPLQHSAQRSADQDRTLLSAAGGFPGNGLYAQTTALLSAVSFQRAASAARCSRYRH